MTLSTRTLVMALSCAFTLPADIVHAQPHQVSRFQSPINFAAEFKLGPYTPQIDSTVQGDPFAHIMGDGGIMVQGEFDWQVWRGFGSVGLGASFGYYSKGARPLKDNGTDTSVSSSEERVAGETSITLLPMSILAVYRFDVLALRLGIPLVPYAKLGFNYTFWWITRGDGDIAQYKDEAAKGGSWGLQFNLGVALLLDIFEPQSAKTLDADLGVNHTYLFIEFHHVTADRFGAAAALDVGDTTFFAGLAFEM